jgi:hypothetical protein
MGALQATKKGLSFLGLWVRFVLQKEIEPTFLKQFFLKSTASRMAIGKKTKREKPSLKSIFPV